MSKVFRELLQKVGSGTHTHENLSRQEAETATRMMLTQEATPAQIGAFMIAHRIKRPTAAELAGMLDAYAQLGPQLKPIASSTPPLVMGIPYDGRSRTAPIVALTSLILTAAGCPVVLHGGQRMPTKYGLPLIELWQGLDVDWQHLTLEQTQSIFEATRLGLLYLPQHFPLAEKLVTYRDEIGKRPPFATIELMWFPYEGSALMASGFVHPPTEMLFQQTIELRGTPTRFVSVKGLEGSCDLPRERTVIVGVGQFHEGVMSLERLLLHPRDYGMAGTDVPLGSLPEFYQSMHSVLKGESSELAQSAIWNAGFYLWQCGLCSDLSAGLSEAERILTQGQALDQLQALQKALTAFKE